MARGGQKKKAKAARALALALAREQSGDGHRDTLINRAIRFLVLVVSGLIQGLQPATLFLARSRLMNSGLRFVGRFVTGVILGLVLVPVFIIATVVFSSESTASEPDEEADQADLPDDIPTDLADDIPLLEESILQEADQADDIPPLEDDDQADDIPPLEDDQPSDQTGQTGPIPQLEEMVRCICFLTRLVFSIVFGIILSPVFFCLVVSDYIKGISSFQPNPIVVEDEPIEVGAHNIGNVIQRYALAAARKKEEKMKKKPSSSEDKKKHVQTQALNRKIMTTNLERQRNNHLRQRPHR